MNETNHNPKTCVRRISRDVARIAIELETPVCDDPITPEILRKESDAGDATIQPAGFIFRGITNHWVAITHVRSGDVVMVKWKTPSGTVIACSTFEVSDTFALRVMEPVRFNISDAFIPSAHLIEADEGSLLHNQDSAIQRIFTDRHPAWIQQPLEVALKQWRSECPTLFLRIAPHTEIQREIALLVRYDPRRALAEYSGSLDADQFKICLERNPESAVRHAFRRIPRADRTFAIGCLRTVSARGSRA